MNDAIMQEGGEEEEGAQGLFAGLTFTVIPNGLSDDQHKQVVEDVRGARGTCIPFDVSSGHIEPVQFEKINYIVSNTSDFPDYYHALDKMKHVVKPSWVHASLRVGKAKNPRSFSPDPALFLSEVVVCCGDIPSGDKEAIEGGVLALGGQIAYTLSKSVTHLVALDISEQRCQLAISKRLDVKIILPHWFDDCLKVGRRISERPYTLPDPAILTSEAGTIPNARTSQQIRDATSPDPLNDPVPPSSNPHLEKPRAIEAFRGKRVKLGEDVNISDKLRRIIKSMIEAGGGSVTAEMDDADIYVCAYRDGPDYINASRSGKDVGNLSWLYYLITHNVWTNPMRRMMHYPRPRKGVPGFTEYKISISSYTGEARLYLENLIKAAGAEYTKTFKQDNTHLVTAHKNSEKCDAAAEWGVNVVNHLWLEESYAKCKEMTLTDTRYTYFPPGTNLGEVLGQTEIDRDATRKMFFPPSRTPGKSSKSAGEVHDGPSSSVRRMPSEPAAHSSPVTEMATRTKSEGSAQTPLPARHAKGKENQTPGSRGAKDRALSRIHDAAPDIARYEKERKRVGGVIHGGRRRSENEVDEKAKKSTCRDSIGTKRSIEEAKEGEDTEEESAETTPKNKRAKKDRLTAIKFRMLVSMDSRWDGDDEKASRDKARLRELGLFISDDFKKVDVVCAPKAGRTKKFVAALACAPTLVSTSYLDYALKNNTLPPMAEHPLDASEFEKTSKFRFEEALERAKQNKHRLLKDWTIFCTTNVAGGFDTYKDIIEANGGQCSLWKGRTTTVMASKRQLDTDDKEISQNQEEDEGDVLYLISHSSKKDMAGWAKFRELADKHDMTPRIVSTEWLLFVAMAQYVHWDPAWELSEGGTAGVR